MEDNMTLAEKLLGTEGLKFDVTANLSPEIYLKLGVTIVGAVLIAVVGAQIIKDALKN